MFDDQFVERNLASEEGNDPYAGLNPVGLEKGRKAFFFAAVQRQVIHLRVQREESEMEGTHLDARPCGVLDPAHDGAAGQMLDNARLEEQQNYRRNDEHGCAESKRPAPCPRIHSTPPPGARSICSRDFVSSSQRAASRLISRSTRTS